MTSVANENPNTQPLGSHTNMALPLAGLRIVELSSFVAVPLGGMTLAQLGAEVIRVDVPGGGPDIGRWPLAADNKTSMYWAGLNKHKKSAEIEWRTPEGAKQIADLICDSGPGGAIVITNGRQKHALGFDELVQRRNDLIHVSVKGRHDGRPAVDYTVNAQLGFPHITGPSRAGSPINHVLPAWDISCGLYVAIAVIAAERQRQNARLQNRTAAPQKIEVPLEDVGLATVANLGYLAEAEVTGVRRKPIGNQLFGSFGNDFVTADGDHIMLIALTKRHWRDLAAMCEIGPVVEALEASTGCDFEVEGDRYTHADVLCALIQNWFSKKATADALSALKACSVLYSTYGDVIDWLADDATALVTNPMMQRIYQPGIGEHWSASSPIGWVGAERKVVRAPKLGEHTAEFTSSGDSGSSA